MHPLSSPCCLPPVLIVSLPVCFAVLGVDMLSKALAPLHRRGVAEPELLLVGVGGVRTHAADKDRFPHAALAAASPLCAMSTLFMLHLECFPDCRLLCVGSTIPLRVWIRRSPRNPNPLLIVDKLVCKSSKELNAAPCPVVCADDLLEKKGRRRHK